MLYLQEITSSFISFKCAHRIIFILSRPKYGTTRDVNPCVVCIILELGELKHNTIGSGMMLAKAQAFHYLSMMKYIMNSTNPHHKEPYI